MKYRKESMVLFNMKYLKYLWYVLKHKFWVAYYCHKNNITWRGILHDLSKFSPTEFIAYTNKFYGVSNNIKSGRNKSGHYDPLSDKSFQKAWHHHTIYNKHHWQYWTVVSEDGNFVCVDIPEKYLIEMVCDWLGASRAQGNNNKNRHIKFYDENINKMHFTNRTRKDLELILSRYFIS